jgi:hypothetical protein
MAAGCGKLADHLGLVEFRMLAISGGAPYAYSAAWQCPLGARNRNYQRRTADCRSCRSQRIAPALSLDAAASSNVSRAPANIISWCPTLCCQTDSDPITTADLEVLASAVQRSCEITRRSKRVLKVRGEHGVDLSRV